MTQRNDYCKIELIGPDRASIVKALKDSLKFIEQGEHYYNGYINKTNVAVQYEEKE